MILVSGAAVPRPQDVANAEEVGRRLAEAGATVLTGGGGGVMEAASRGARGAGGTALGILPGDNDTQSPPNPHLSISVFSGMGVGRNLVLVRAADAIISIGGGWGTLSEIALAANIGKPVILLDSWGLDAPDPRRTPPLPRAGSPEGAVAWALAAAKRG